MKPSKRTTRTGFSLIEMLVVVSIAAILLAISFPMIAAMRRDTRCQHRHQYRHRRHPPPSGGTPPTPSKTFTNDLVRQQPPGSHHPWRPARCLQRWRCHLHPPPVKYGLPLTTNSPARTTSSPGIAHWNCTAHRSPTIKPPRRPASQIANSTASGTGRSTTSCCPQIPASQASTASAAAVSSDPVMASIPSSCPRLSPSGTTRTATSSPPVGITTTAAASTTSSSSTTTATTRTASRSWGRRPAAQAPSAAPSTTTTPTNTTPTPATSTPTTGT